MQAIYTAQDLCKILKIGKNTAYELVKSQGFPSYRINRKYFVTEEALNSWLSSVKGKEFNL